MLNLIVIEIDGQGNFSRRSFHVDELRGFRYVCHTVIDLYGNKGGGRRRARLQFQANVLQLFRPMIKAGRFEVMLLAVGNFTQPTELPLFDVLLPK